MWTSTARFSRKTPPNPAFKNVLTGGERKMMLCMYGCSPESERRRLSQELRAADQEQGHASA
eukprot:2988209-Prorocentrum_lima.AAC.1